MNDILEANREFPWIFEIFIFLFGACMGSFMNVCIYRIPQGKSIIRPGSRCQCGAPIKWYDNIPILSWFILRGKARCCGQKFSFRYPFNELLCACLYLYLWLSHAPALALALMFFLSLMLVVSFIDFDTLELSDALTVGGFLAGLVISALVPELHLSEAYAYRPFLANSIESLALALAGAFVGTGILFWFRLLAEYLFKREAMGEGDVVLIGCIGAFCGWQGAVFSIFGGSVLGSVLMIPIVIFNKCRSKPEGGCEIPFGPWLALGAAIYVLFLKADVDLYFASIAGMFSLH